MTVNHPFLKRPRVVVGLLRCMPVFFVFDKFDAWHARATIAPDGNHAVPAALCKVQRNVAELSREILVDEQKVHFCF